MLARLGDGSYAQPSKTTLAEFLNGEWLPAIEGTVRPLTYAQHASADGRSLAGTAYVDGALVFAEELGCAIHPHRLTAWFGKHRKAAGIPTGTPHILRHTAATLAFAEGVPVHIVAARLGDDPTTVLSTYAYLLPQSDELAAERVAALLAG